MGLFRRSLPVEKVPECMFFFTVIANAETADGYEKWFGGHEPLTTLVGLERRQYLWESGASLRMRFQRVGQPWSREPFYDGLGTDPEHHEVSALTVAACSAAVECIDPLSPLRNWAIQEAERIACFGAAPAQGNRAAVTRKALRALFAARRKGWRGSRPPESITSKRLRVRAPARCYSAPLPEYQPTPLVEPEVVVGFTHLCQAAQELFEEILLAHDWLIRTDRAR